MCKLDSFDANETKHRCQDRSCRNWGNPSIDDLERILLSGGITLIEVGGWYHSTRLDGRTFIYGNFAWLERWTGKRAREFSARMPGPRGLLHTYSCVMDESSHQLD